MVIPSAVHIGGKAIALERLTLNQLTAFQQEQALDAMMKGTPFGDIIAHSVRIGSIWANHRAAK